MEISAGKMTLVRKVQSAKWRHEYRKFSVSGVRAVNEVISSGHQIEFIVACVHELTSEGRAFIREIDQIRVFDITAKEMRSVDKATTSQGVLAVVNMKPPLNPDGLVDSKRILALDEISNPSNMGSMMRSALAFGFSDVLLGEGSADIYSHKVISASAGMQFRLNVHRRVDLRELIGRLGSAGVTVYGSGSEGIPVPGDLPDRLCLVIGNEARGVSPEVIALCDSIISIRISSDCESLSAPVAAGILMKDMGVFASGS